jgi:hypothetical protein
VTHTIRLQGPWELLTARGPMRFQAPGSLELTDHSDVAGGEIRCRRRFHRPTGIAGSTVHLVVAPTPHSSNTEVFLDNCSLGSTSSSELRFELNDLKQASMLELKSRYDSPPPPDAPLIGEVRLEIDDRQRDC